MRKIIFLISIFFVLGISLLPGKVFAAEEITRETVEEEDLHKLIFDPTREVFEDKIVPPPAPTPFKKEEPTEDKRSWTISEYKDLIKEVSKKYNVDAQVIYATIMTESEGNRFAFRYEPAIKDASLCMGQILINTAKSLGFEGPPKDLYKPEVCIDLIGKYHRNMLDTYGNLNPLQLATAYNAGSPWKRAVPGHLSRFQKWLEEETS